MQEFRRSLGSTWRYRTRELHGVLCVEADLKKMTLKGHERNHSQNGEENPGSCMSFREQDKGPVSVRSGSQAITS